MQFARSVQRYLGLCAVLAVPALAQTDGRIVVTYGGPPRSVAEPIVGVPFAVQFQTQQMPIEPGTSAGATFDMPAYRLWHDSSGRSRVEIVLSGQISIIELRDFAARYEYVLDPVHQIVHRMRLPDKTSSSAPRLIADSLVETIEGVPLGDGTVICRTGGTMTTAFAPGSLGNDQPLAIEHKSWVLDTHVYRRVRERSKSSDIRRGEPDPTLFRIPTDYQVVDESGPFAIQFTIQSHY